jgi:hypothetical protein
MRRKSPSTWTTTRYANLAHFGVSSQTWNHTDGRKPLRGLTFATSPIRETSPADSG